MLVQRFQPQGRRFTNFHYYYYYKPHDFYFTRNCLYHVLSLSRVLLCNHKAEARGEVFVVVAAGKNYGEGSINTSLPTHFVLSGDQLMGINCTPLLFQAKNQSTAAQGEVCAAAGGKNYREGSTNHSLLVNPLSGDQLVCVIPLF